MSLREDLIAAKALIADEAHWGKGSFALAPDCYCALGAVAKAVGHPPDYPWQGRPSNVRDLLTEALPSSHSFVVTFNDHPSTTHADVLALFDRAIAKAEPQP